MSRKQTQAYTEEFRREAVRSDLVWFTLIVISSLFAERAGAPASVVAIAAGWGRGGRKIHRDQHGRIGERTA